MAVNLQQEVVRLTKLIEKIGDLLVDARLADCENGVAWLNDKASAEYLMELKYRHTREALSQVLELIQGEWELTDEL